MGVAMKITTKEFGDIEVRDEDIIKFNRSIYGFENNNNYVILKDLPDDDIMYLQSVDDTSLHFVIVDPYVILPNYDPKLSKDDMSALNITKDEVLNLKYMLIAVITEKIENSVVNLKNPLVINPNNKQAIQAILENQDYPLRYPLFINDMDGDASC